jgi:hypothetical protein
MKLTRALIIPADGMPTTTMVASPQGDFINATVGGWFDCVRSERFHGYVNDTGLIDGLSFNPIASIMFGQVVCGDAILFGSFNAQNEYDGDEHHIDENVIEGAKQQWFLWKHNADEREMRTI